MIKYKTFIIKTFDQVKNDNFDQVKFDQPTPCPQMTVECFQGAITSINRRKKERKKYLLSI